MNFSAVFSVKTFYPKNPLVVPRYIGDAYYNAKNYTEAKKYYLETQSNIDSYLIHNKNMRSNSMVINEQNYIKEKLKSIDYSSEHYISSSTIYNKKLKPLFDNLSANLKNNDTLYNDKIYYNFQKDFSKIVNEMNEKGVDNIFEEDACYGNKIVEGNKNLYNQMKIFITTNECGYIFNPNWSQLQSNYGKFLSPTYNNWLSYLERNKKIFEDAGLIIEVDKLRENIIYLEKMLTNDNFVAKNDVKNTLNFMLEVYLTVIDNTPVFSYDNDILKSDFKNSYEKFLAENQESKYYLIVKHYYDMLKDNNYKKSDKIDSWIRNQIQ